MKKLALILSLAALTCLANSLPLSEQVGFFVAPKASAGGGGADVAYITALPSYDGAFTAANTNGYWLHFTNNFTVTTLGRFVRAGDAGQTLRVVMRDSSCALVASAMVSSVGTVGTSNVVACTPFTATAGSEYSFAVEFDGGGDQWSNNGATFTHTSIAAGGAIINDFGGECDRKGGQSFTPVVFLGHP